MLSCLEFERFDILSGSTLVMLIAACWLCLRVTRGQFFGRTYLLISAGAMIAWLLVKFFEVGSTSASCEIFWSKIAWPAIVLLPTAWAFFLSDYANGRSTPFRGLRRLLIIIGPLVAGLVALTNDWHGALYGPLTGPAIDPATGALDQNSQRNVIYDHGWFFYVMVLYLYGMLGRFFWLTLRSMICCQPEHQLFYGSLVLMTLLPVLANVSYVLFGFTLGGYEPTPLTFAWSLAIWALQSARNGLRDIDVLAKDILYDNSTNPVIVVDAEGRVLTRNREAMRMFGLDSANAVEIRQLGKELRGFFEEIMRTQGRPSMRSLIIRRRFYDPEITPMYHETGPHSRLIGWVVRFEDNTERRFLSDALQAERDFLSRLMETSMSGILALDSRGRVLFINAEAETILGVEGLTLDDLRLDDAEWDYQTVDGQRLEGLDQMLRNLISRLHSVRNHKLALKRRNDGARRIISVNATLLDSLESDSKLVVALGDVTDQHFHEVMLREAAIKSEQANRSKSQFIANMSHEIRTPLNGVLGMAEVLERLIKDPEQHRMLTTIQHSGELLLTILNDVLDMSKIEAGKLELEATIFKPDQLAARIEDLYAVAAEEKQLDFEVFTAGRADISRVGDPHRIMQIMQNLVSNAIKFTKEGEISVVFSCPAGKPMVIEVRDTGIGMNAEQIERMFRAFEQADGSMTRKFGGTGLGMAIVERLVEIMNGKIEVESALGEGTLIRVTLPLEEV